MNNGEQIVNERVGVYGDPAESFARVAQVWSGILGFEVHAWQVPLCQAGLKLVRANYAPDYSDNPDDVEGYIDIFRQVIGDDMVLAKSVTEYLDKKGSGPIVDTVVPKPVDKFSHNDGRLCEWDASNEMWVWYDGANLEQCVRDHEQDQVVDTFTHSNVQMPGFGTERVCTWSPKMQGWYFEHNGQRWVCSMRHAD